jgi:hypothetical protein
MQIVRSNSIALLLFFICVYAPDAYAKSNKVDSCTGVWSVYLARTSAVYCRVHNSFILQRRAGDWLFYHNERALVKGIPDPDYSGEDGRDTCKLNGAVITRIKREREEEEKEEENKTKKRKFKEPIVDQVKLIYHGKDIDVDQRGRWNSRSKRGCAGTFWIQRRY